jgi:starch synthase
MNILMTVANPYSHDPRVRSEAEALVEAGHTVHVVSWDRRGAFERNEKINGVLVHRISNTSTMKAMPLDILRMRFWWKEAIRREAPHIDLIDIIHCHDLDTLPIGVRLKELRKIPLIYDAHEIWGFMVSADIPWWKHYIRLEKRWIQHADLMITVNDPLQEYYTEFFAKPIHVVMNCKEFDRAPYQPPTEKAFTALYIGSLSKSRQILEIVSAASKVPEMALLIAGSGKKRYVEKVRKLCERTKNVKFLGQIPHNEVLQLTKKYHVSICLFERDNMNNQVGMPNKVFEAMVTGRPLITTKGLYYSDFAREKGFGIPVESAAECVEAIKKLMMDPKRCEEYGVKALEAALEYNWANEKQKLIEIYDELGKKHRA